MDIQLRERRVVGGGRASRQADSTMAASLKALYRQIKAFNEDQNEELVASR